MKTVISASRRTDIPAFYLNWFIASIKQGFVEVQNPLYKKQTRLINLDPDQVSWIVFWSRNYNQFLKKRRIFDPYRLFFHFTVLSPNPLLENHHLPQEKAITQMSELAKLYGPESIIWRYDPLVVWRQGGDIQTNFDKENFTTLCKAFSALGIKRCYFSLVTGYRKFQQRLKEKYPDWHLLTNSHPLALEIVEELREIATAQRIALFSCCNDALIGPGINRGHCISGQLLNQISAKKEVSEARSATRPDCGCTASVDIGSYTAQPCPYGCIYCYANPLWK